MEILPAAPLTVDFVISPVAASVTKPLKVPETISANAAVTIRVNNQQNSKKSFLPVLPMYCSINIPMDFPSFFTLAYSAPKSVTAPKKIPPSKIHNRTGSQPNAAA